MANREPRIHNEPAEPWTDPNRPAGSGYSAEEWAAAEASNPGCVVFEMVKAAERGLLAMPNSGFDDVFSRSLLIHEMADCAYRSHSTIRMEFHGEFGVFNYLVVRSRASREKSPWADGARLVMKDEKHSPAEPAPGQRGTGSGRSQRYR